MTRVKVRAGANMGDAPSQRMLCSRQLSQLREGFLLKGQLRWKEEMGVGDLRSPVLEADTPASQLGLDFESTARQSLLNSLVFL